MAKDLATQWKEIDLGGEVQFVPAIQIPAANFNSSPQVETVLELPALMSTLWIPPTYVDGSGNIVANPVGIIIGVRFNSPSAPRLPMGLAGNCVASFAGPVKRIYYSLLSGSAATLVLLAARGIGIGYSGALTGAGTPSASPSTSPPSSISS